MTIAVVSSGTPAFANNANVNAAFGSTSIANQIALLFGGSKAASFVTLGASSGYTDYADRTSNAQTIEIFGKVAVAGETFGQIVPSGGATGDNIGGVGMLLSGCNIASPVGNSASTSGTSATAVTTPALTVANDGSIIILAVTLGGAFTATGAFNPNGTGNWSRPIFVVDTSIPGNHQTLAVYYTIQTAKANITAGSFAVTATADGSVQIRTVMLAINPAALVLAGAPASISTATGTLVGSPTGLSGDALDVSTAGGAVTPWASVTLAAPLYIGIGSILDPNFWFDAIPAAGTIVYYDPTFITILSDGEIIAANNNCQGAVQFYDAGGQQALGLVVITAFNVGYPRSISIATGALTFPLVLRGAALDNSTALATLVPVGPGNLAGAAIDQSAASGLLIGTSGNLAGAAMAQSLATAELSATIAPLLATLDPMKTVISQYSNSPVLLQLVKNVFDYLLS